MPAEQETRPACQRMFWEGVDRHGRVIYFLPPHPLSHRRDMLVVHDWVKNPDLYEMSGKGTISNLGPDGRAILYRNYLNNKSLGFRQDWKRLWGSKQGKTCLLVSCGPSLRESLPEIRELAADKSRYFTFGINRAIRALPLDLYMASDRRASCGYGASDWMPATNPKDTTLIAATTVPSEIPRRFRPDNVYWGEGVRAEESGDATNLASLLTITICDAIIAAYKLGAGRVLLYGCDYALTATQEGDKADGGRPREEYYYFDTLADKGMEVHRIAYPENYPVKDRFGGLCLTNWELLCNAAYTACAAYMLERAGIPVENRSRFGLLWESWKEPGLGNNVSDAVPVCSAAVPG